MAARKPKGPEGGSEGGGSSGPRQAGRAGGPPKGLEGGSEGGGSSRPRQAGRAGGPPKGPAGGSEGGVPGPGYNPTELMICIAARQMEDRSTAFIGTGIPLLAASLAKNTHAPNLIAVFEFGGTAPLMERLPTFVGGTMTFQKAMAASSICDIMEASCRGFIEYGFLGGAQIDPYGNLNSTVIGDYKSPKVRFPGSGGANDVGSMCWRTIAIMKHDKKRFLPKVDFITTPGYLSGPGARERAGLPKGTGPYRVVSDLALLGFDDATKRMKLLALNPGVTVEQVVENTGFELVIPPKVGSIEAPTPRELKLLREVIDPHRYYI